MCVMVACAVCCVCVCMCYVCFRMTSPMKSPTVDRPILTIDNVEQLIFHPTNDNNDNNNNIQTKHIRWCKTHAIPTTFSQNPTPISKITFMANYRSLFNGVYNLETTSIRNETTMLGVPKRYGIWQMCQHIALAIHGHHFYWKRSFVFYSPSVCIVFCSGFLICFSIFSFFSFIFKTANIFITDRTDSTQSCIDKLMWTFII